MYSVLGFSRVSLIVGLLAGVALAAGGCSRDVRADETEAKMNDWFQMRDGELQRPVGFREWVYVGTPVTPNDMNNGKAPFPEFHNVYVDPSTWSQWKETGRFPDGAVVIKELISVGSKKAVSGNGYFMGEYIGLEAAIKSSSDFPDEPGNWAYFSFSTPDHETLKGSSEPFPTSSCNSCHDANAGDDWVFTQYYPALRAAKGTGSRGIGGVTDRLPRTMPAAGMGAAAATAPAPDATWQPTASTPESSPSEAPLDEQALFKYLRSGRYRSFKAQESSTHPGRGPHTEIGLPVKVFYNASLARSMKSGSSSHPSGATAIKEMYDASGELQGWAVMVKTGADTDDGRGWFWYEVTSATDSTAIAAVGNGVPGCISCHARGGTDLVRSGYPLK